MTRVTKIISGAQIGADIAGLRAGKRLKLETGGWIPRGFKTKDGPRPEYASEYGIQEHDSPRYPPRTYRNVQDADGTVRFAYDFSSPGELCTLRAITEMGRPYFDAPVAWNSQAGKRICIADPAKFVSWIEAEGIGTLNVAGNATHWIEAVVEEWLVNALR